jgi:hypothetical protein
MLVSEIARRMRKKAVPFVVENAGGGRFPHPARKVPSSPLMGKQYRVRFIQNRSA